MIIDLNNFEIDFDKLKDAFARLLRDMKLDVNTAWDYRYNVVELRSVGRNRQNYREAISAHN